MINIKQTLRSCAFAALFLGASGCCCCGGGDSSFLSDLVGDQIEQAGEKYIEQAKQAQEQAAKAHEAIQEQAEEAKAEQATTDQATAEPKQDTEQGHQLDPKLQKQIDEGLKQLEELTGKLAQPTTPAPPAKAISRDGEFQSNTIQKTGLTSARLRLTFAGSKVTGTFIGQYNVRPYSLKLNGTVDANGAFKVSSKVDDNDLTITGTNDGNTLSGDIKGLLRGKAIVAKYTANRR